MLLFLKGDLRRSQLIMAQPSHKLSPPQTCSKGTPRMLSASALVRRSHVFFRGAANADEPERQWRSKRENCTKHGLLLLASPWSAAIEVSGSGMIIQLERSCVSAMNTIVPSPL